MNFLLAASDVSITEVLGNTLIGLLVVFFTLAFLSGIISLFKYLAKLDQSAAKPAAKPPVKAAAPAAGAMGGEDPAVVAAILAIVAETCGPNAVVTSIQRSK
ncbi:MAG: OadG family protein [Lachnospiraceae bacterium]|nr:OadG family protein [Lachnospiraceae bacterium]